MKYYSTNGKVPAASLRDAVFSGLAGDRGLYMPERIDRLPRSFFDSIQDMGFPEISFRVARAFFGEDIPEKILEELVYDAMDFECPVVGVEENIFALELFHGPTLAFKDVGARFMARLLGYFIAKEGMRDVNVLVATSGDTGSAVANGFFGVEGIHVYVLYPKGKVSHVQECQFATLGGNVTAVEVDGVFDDCQRLVKSAFMDAGLREGLRLTSANSINIARLLPQSFYYFNAYAQLRRMGIAGEITVSVPSGNFGNLTSGIIAKRMGLPVSRFIAANNANDVFCRYLSSGEYMSGPSVQTVANAMDVGDPSNFARIMDLYGGRHAEVLRETGGASFGDGQIKETIREVYARSGYILDPHGACAFRALEEGGSPGGAGIFLATAHPAKFPEVVEEAIGEKMPVPAPLAGFLSGRKRSVPLSRDYASFRALLEVRQG